MTETRVKPLGAGETSEQGWADGLALYAMLVVPPLLWSTLIVVGRAVIGVVPPLSLTFWTWLFAALALLPFSARALWQNRHRVFDEWGRLLFLSFTGIAAFQALYYLGLERTTAVNTAILTPTQPVFISCVAWALVGERVGPRGLLGVAITVLGVLFIEAGGDVQTLAAFRFNPGDGLILLANLSMAFYTTFLRRTPSSLSPIPFMTVLASVGSLLLVPFWLWEARGDPSGLVPWRYFPAILYIGAVTYVLGYVFWNMCVARAGANRPALFLYLVPVFAVIFAAIFLGEFVHWYHGVGTAAIFLGIYLALKGSPKPLRTSIE